MYKVRRVVGHIGCWGMVSAWLVGGLVSEVGNNRDAQTAAILVGIPALLCLFSWFVLFLVTTIQSRRIAAMTCHGCGSSYYKLPDQDLRTCEKCDETYHIDCWPDAGCCG